MKILGIPDLLYMFPIFPAFLQNQSDRGEGWVGGPKILLCDKTENLVIRSEFRICSSSMIYVIK